MWVCVTQNTTLRGSCTWLTETNMRNNHIGSCRWLRWKTQAPLHVRVLLREREGIDDRCLSVAVHYSQKIADRSFSPSNNDSCFSRAAHQWRTRDVWRPGPAVWGELPPLSPPVCIVKILENLCKRLLSSDLIGLKLSLWCYLTKGTNATAFLQGQRESFCLSKPGSLFIYRAEEVMFSSMSIDVFVGFLVSRLVSRIPKWLLKVAWIQDSVQIRIAPINFYMWI